MATRLYCSPGNNYFVDGPRTRGTLFQPCSRPPMVSSILSTERAPVRRTRKATGGSERGGKPTRRRQPARSINPPNRPCGQTLKVQATSDTATRFTRPSQSARPTPPPVGHIFRTRPRPPTRAARIHRADISAATAIVASRAHSHIPRRSRIRKVPQSVPPATAASISAATRQRFSACSFALCLHGGSAIA